jgi:hypothetical protein
VIVLLMLVVIKKAAATAQRRLLTDRNYQTAFFVQVFIPSNLYSGQKVKAPVNKGTKPIKPHQLW